MWTGEAPVAPNLLFTSYGRDIAHSPDVSSFVPEEEGDLALHALYGCSIILQIYGDID